MLAHALTTTGFDEDYTALLERSPSGCRAHTKAARWVAVERVIRAMYARLDEPLSLQDMADVAMLSPYHLNRVFRHVTGIPPRKFLAALRIEAAKRLLLTTHLSVAEICFEVGYNSQGTFTTLFTQFVGVSPRQLRRFADDHVMVDVDELVDYDAHLFDHARPGTYLTGQISAASTLNGPIFVGLFPTPIPQGRPIACTCIDAPGAYAIPDVHDGSYYVSAVAYDQHANSLEYLLPNQALLRVGATPRPVEIHHGQVIQGTPDVTLRQTSLIDPPILIALPSLLAEQAIMKRVSAA